MAEFRLFLKAVSSHAVEMVGGSIVSASAIIWAVMTKLWPNLEWPAFPPWMLFAIGASIYGRGAFLAWREEHQTRIREGESAKLVAERQANEIAALKANPPVVLLEFTSDTLVRPGSVQVLNQEYPKDPIQPAQLTVRASLGSVLNVRIKPLSFKNTKVRIKPPHLKNLELAFDQILEVGTGPRPVQAVLRWEYPAVHGDTHKGYERTGTGLFDMLTADCERFTSRTTRFSVEYGTPGRRYVTEISFKVELHENGIAKIIETRHDDTREIEPMPPS
jgi:hypothetical protein